MNQFNQFEVIKAEEKHLHRLYRQHDELDRLMHETANQMDAIAREIELSRTALTLLRMNRTPFIPAEITPIRMEIL